jgi:hypothetical protein
LQVGSCEWGDLIEEKIGQMMNLNLKMNLILNDETEKNIDKSDPKKYLS